MPTYKTSVSVAAEQSTALQACRAVVSEMKLVVKRDSINSIIGSEKANLFGFAWPAKIEVIVSPSTGGCSISIKASNGGIGPIQSNHVKGVAETFASNLKLKLSAAQSLPSDAGLAAQLEKLARLKQQGLLSEDEYAAAKAKLLRSNSDPVD